MNSRLKIERQRGIIWPRRHKIFGVCVSETTYIETLSLIIQAVKHRIPAIVDHMPVHGLIEATRDPYFRTVINSFNIVAPDGQPVRYALSLLHNINLPDRVYGPELMLKLCGKAAENEIGVFLLGSYPHVVEKLRVNLTTKFPSLQVVGYESPPFRPLTNKEEKSILEKINLSCAGIVFLGLGCPKQEVFAYKHFQNINAVQVCVGAAFDFYSGNKKMAPAWVQRCALEWLFRLIQEPQRLWRRYFMTNTIFLLKLIMAYSRLRKY